MASIYARNSLTQARLWHHIDAKGQVLGRVAVQAAQLLMGKHKPLPYKGFDNGDYVVITNAKDIVVTGNKADQKLYRHHTGFPGGLKEIPFKRVMERKPHEILLKAVSGMLPKNNLRRNFMRRLRVVPDAEHPYEANLYRTAQTAPQGSDADLERLRQLMFTELKDAHKVARTMGVQALAAQIGVNPVLATKPALKTPPRSAATS